MFNKVGSASLVDIIYNEIKKKIIENELKPDERLDIDFLSESLGVSRTPVINALKALEKDGYVIINPRSSSCVRGLTKEETEAVFDFRAALESTVVRKVTGKLSAERLMEFRKVFIEFLNSMESFISPEELIRGFFDIETQLHEYMIKACPSIISGEIMNLMDLTKRIRHLHMLYKLNNMNASAFNDEVGLHVRLIDSLVAEDIPVSVKLIEKDILDTKDEIMKCFDIINGI